MQSIDALRGVAALGVVFYHTLHKISIVNSTPGQLLLMKPLLWVFSFGYVGVYLFFVISGFCIHLQWARARTIDSHPEINFAAFWKRRLRRLYPPYLIALALYLIILVLTKEVQLTRFFAWDVLLHLLMLHNLDPRTCYSINGVFWTLAIEEQLYLAYFLLLFLRVRWGWARTLLICAAARLGWFFFAGKLKSSYGIEIPVSESALSHWFTWALGAVSVEAAMGLIKLPAWTRSFRLGFCALLCAVGLTYAQTFFEGATHDTAWLLVHPVWGLGFFFLVNGAVAAEKRWREVNQIPRLVAAFAYVGLFSYSLYLTHQLPQLESWHLYFLGYQTFVIEIILMTPITLLFAWLFYLLCERPFMSKPNRNVAVLSNSSQARDTVPAEGVS
ncbi:MAG: acyltransferase [Pyrinomonadaceae bacterium]